MAILELKFIHNHLSILDRFVICVAEILSTIIDCTLSILIGFMLFHVDISWTFPEEITAEQKPNERSLVGLGRL